MENEVNSPNEKVLNVSIEEQEALVHHHTHNKQQVILYYPQDNQESIEEQAELSSHSNIPLKYELSEPSSNLLSIVGGSWTVSEYKCYSKI